METLGNNEVRGPLNAALFYTPFEVDVDIVSDSVGLAKETTLQAIKDEVQHTKYATKDISLTTTESSTLVSAIGTGTVTTAHSVTITVTSGSKALIRFNNATADLIEINPKQTAVFDKQQVNIIYHKADTGTSTISVFVSAP